MTPVFVAMLIRGKHLIDRTVPRRQLTANETSASLMPGTRTSAGHVVCGPWEPNKFDFKQTVRDLSKLSEECFWDHVDWLSPNDVISGPVSSIF
jgi:hypothetical protein